MTDTPAPAGDARRISKPIILDEPLHRGEQVIDRVQVRRPSAGEMRGLNLQNVMQSDVNTMIALIPRVTVPPLLPHEVESPEFSPVDFLAISGEITGFFYSKADLEMLAKVMGQIEQDPSSI